MRMEGLRENGERRGVGERVRVMKGKREEGVRREGNWAGWRE